jgi:arylsulfatase
MEKDPSQKTNVLAEHPAIAKQMNSVYDKWFDGALLNMVNEDAPLTGHNTFHLMFWKQYVIDIPPVKKRKPRPRKKKKSTTE